MRVFCAAVVIASLAGSAYAQDAVPKYGETAKTKTPQERENDRAAERAYKNSLSNIPDRAASDPWGSVRNDNTAKAVAKPAPAKPHAKIGSTAK
jgi:hypothetical protein